MRRVLVMHWFMPHRRAARGAGAAHHDRLTVASSIKLAENGGGVAMEQAFHAMGLIVFSGMRKSF